MNLPCPYWLKRRRNEAAITPMDFNSFEDLHGRLQALHQAQEFAAALELANQGLVEFPEERMMLDYWRITMSARIGQTSQAKQLLKKALDEGRWYGETLLRKSPSLLALQEDEDYQELVQTSLALYWQDQHLPLLTLRPQGRCQAGEAPCPLLIGLHSNFSNAQDSVEIWSNVATAGWLVAVPQSSQGMWKNAYVWNDRDLAVEEVRKHYASLTEKYACDPQRLIIAGHSLGGETALWVALTQAIPARAFIAYGPGGPLMDELDELEKLVREYSAREYSGPALRGYIIIGELDRSIPQDNISHLVQILNEAGISCKLGVIPAAAHDYVPEVGVALRAAIREVEFQHEDNL